MYLEYQVKRSEFYYFYSRQWKVNNGFCTGKGYDQMCDLERVLVADLIMEGVSNELEAKDQLCD